MEAYNLMVGTFSEKSVRPELDNLIEQGYVERTFMGRHPKLGYPYDEFRITDAGRKWVTDEYGPRIGYEIMDDELRGRL